jgi:hypothetical protein
MVSFCAVRLELEENAEDVDINFNCNRSIEVSLISSNIGLINHLSISFNFNKSIVVSCYIYLNINVNWNRSIEVSSILIVFLFLNI